MARSRSFRGRGISDSQRRKKSWIQVTGPAALGDGTSDGQEQTPNMILGLPDATPTGNNFSQSVGLISDPVLDKVPAESTILRLRGSVDLPKNGLVAADVENFAIAIGVMESGAAQLGAFPNPATPDGGAWDGWMFYRSQQQGNLDANSGIVDVKSMRKVPSGSSIIIVFGRFLASPDGGVVGAVTGLNAAINLRALILLP